MESDFKKLQREVAELKAEVAKLKAQGAREFKDTDTVVKRNLYAEKVFTKRSGSYIELTT